MRPAISTKRLKLRGYLLLFMAFFTPCPALSAAITTSTPAPATESDVLLLIVYVVLALGFSFICSVAEAVLLSLTPSFIEERKSKHPKQAKLLKRLKQDNIDQSLAAILTLNTIAHTVGAIGAGAKASAIFGSAWFGLFSMLLTLAILFLSEIVPKTIGALYWSRLAWPIALFILLLIRTLYPLVWISERLTRLISRGKTLHVFSRDEFLAMTRVGERSGQLNHKESRIIRNLFRFDRFRVVDIMTPRTVIVGIKGALNVDEIFDYVVNQPFSRLPVYQVDMDDISGFVLKTDIMLEKAQGRNTTEIKELARELLTVPESVSLSMLLEHLLKERHHIALVVDEYGGTEGLVTLEDVVETLMGIEIMDESDTEQDMRAMARRLWKERAQKLGVEAELVEQVREQHD
ncbi:MAG: hemolysin family protein [Geobacteraceae bacterium]|nr:hemolysin family protein [Geobacteraceae bacterium]